MRVLVSILSALALCQAYNYRGAIRASLLFYEAQRSGKLPPDQRVIWRKDSTLTDKGEYGEDLTGGYFDAGDYVKFGFPMAFTTTVLSWGIVDHTDGYIASTALIDARKAVKWATDYFLKAHVGPNEFYGQVGEGGPDHAYWGRPEDMTMARPAYKIDPQHPGSDLAGETAAALAAASIVFKKTRVEYSKNLLKHAKQLFEFANNFRGKYSDSIADAQNFYSSYDYHDELVWGAAWLYRATGDRKYLNTAENLYNSFGLKSWDGGFTWDQKISGVEVLLAKLTKKQNYKDKVQGYCDYIVNTEAKTPRGLVYIDKWGSLRMASNAVYICLEAADLGINSDTYRQFAKTQINYILGDAGRSFVVGFGHDPPSHVHHRSSSCPDAPKVCGWDAFNTNDSNYHVLTGALVGGPDINDTYADSRQDYVSNEVACDYNAAFQSSLAALVELIYD